MQQIKCYLAGSFVALEGYPDWRDAVEEALGDAMSFYDPRTDTPQTSIASFVSGDLQGVGNSDVVFYFVTGAGDVGAVAECTWGLAKNKLIILCVKEGVTLVHPFIIGLCRRMFIGLPTGIAYLKNLATFGLQDEFKAIYATMNKS